MDITKHLAESKVGQLLAVEPNITELPSKLAKQGIELVSLERALELANIVVVLVDHKEFKAADKTEFAKKVVIDTAEWWHEFTLGAD